MTLARDRAQRGFSSSKTRVLVATSAFGMGVDYPDVRVIVHFQAPGSLEAYYQEAGRAGRDGEPGSCVLLFGASDLVTQRRLSEHQGGGAAIAQRRDDALAALEDYANATTCRQQVLCAHFTGTAAHVACTRCDACVDPEAVSDRASARSARGLRAAYEADHEIATLPAQAREVIVAAVGSLRRPIGKLNVAKMLRGSQCKAMSAHGLLHLPLHGALADASEEAIVATIDQLISERKLVRQGRKYPTVALPGMSTRTPASRRRTDSGATGEQAATSPRSPGVRSTGRAGKPRRPSQATTSVTLELDTYRKRMARQLKWKTYMVLQRGVIAAIDRQRPTTKEALARIPGLGPAKIARFGDDILAVVRRHVA